MCKAGFAGDDAPRAVFRELTPLCWRLPLPTQSVLDSLGVRMRGNIPGLCESDY